MGSAVDLGTPNSHRRCLVTFAVASASNAPRTPRARRTDVVFLFAALRFATARTLRKLGVVSRRAQRSSARVVGHVLPLLIALGYQHEPSCPVIRVWNETRHVESDAIE
jgi:hypothetical protein